MHSNCASCTPAEKKQQKQMNAAKSLKTLVLAKFLESVQALSSGKLKQQMCTHHGLNKTSSMSRWQLWEWSTKCHYMELHSPVEKGNGTHSNKIQPKTQHFNQEASVFFSFFGQKTLRAQRFAPWHPQHCQNPQICLSHLPWRALHLQIEHTTRTVKDAKYQQSQRILLWP